MVTGFERAGTPEIIARQTAEKEARLEREVESIARATGKKITVTSGGTGGTTVTQKEISKTGRVQAEREFQTVEPIGSISARRGLEGRRVAVAEPSPELVPIRDKPPQLESIKETIIQEELGPRRETPEFNNFEQTGIPSQADVFFSSVLRERTPEEVKETLGEKVVTAFAAKLDEQQRKDLAQKLKSFESISTIATTAVVGGPAAAIATAATRPLAIPQAEALEKAALQTTARTIGSEEQKEQAKFFKRGEQSEAFFRAISPVAPRDVTESKVFIDESGAVQVGRFPTGEQELGLNVPGLVNIALAGVTAGLVAAPVLTRPTSPLKGIRGDIGAKVQAFTEKGVTKSTTTLKFQRQSPTLSGAFGRGAETTVTTRQPGGGLDIKTVVGKKTFQFKQPLVEGTPKLTTTIGGKVVSTKPQARVDIGSRLFEGVSTTQLSKPITTTRGEQVVTIQTGKGTAPVTLQTGRLQQFKGDIKFETIVKQVTNVGKTPGSFPVQQATIGTGTLTRQPIAKITPPIPVGVGGVLPGRVDFGFPSTFSPTTGGLTPVRPAVQTSLPKTLKTTPFPVAAPLPIPTTLAPVPPLFFVQPRVKPKSTPSTAPVSRVEPASIGEPLEISQPEPIGKPVPTDEVVSQPEPLIVSPPDVTPDVPSPADVLAPGVPKIDDPIGFQPESIPPVPLPDQFLQPPVIGGAPLIFPAFGGSSGSGFPTGKKRKVKRRATKTIFQAVLELPESDVKALGVAKGQEKTGLRLRF